MASGLHKDRVVLMLVAGLLVPVVMTAAGAGMIRWSAGAWPSPGLPAWTHLLAGAATAVLSVGLIYGLYLSSPAFARALRETGIQVGEDALKAAGYPLMLLVVSLGAIGEEILFRGGLQPIIGLIPAALLFGFSHGGWRREMWAYAVAAAGAGILFGLLYQLTGSLWAPVTAHVTHNVVSTILLGQEDGPFAADDGDPAPAMFAPEVATDEQMAESVPPAPDHEADGSEDWPAPDWDPE